MNVFMLHIESGNTAALLYCNNNLADVRIRHRYICFLKAWYIVMIISKTGKINIHRPKGMLLIFDLNAKMKYDSKPSQIQCVF